jgi:hypothetical protein
MIAQTQEELHCKRPKIIRSPSYVDIRSRANTTMGLDFEHMIKAEHTREG